MSIVLKSPYFAERELVRGRLAYAMGLIVRLERHGYDDAICDKIEGLLWPDISNEKTAKASPSPAALSTESPAVTAASSTTSSSSALEAWWASRQNEITERPPSGGASGE